MGRPFRFVCAHCQRSQTNQTSYTICARCHSDHLDVKAAVALLARVATEATRKQLDAYIIAAATVLLATQKQLPEVTSMARGLMGRVKIHVQQRMLK